MNLNRPTGRSGQLTALAMPVVALAAQPDERRVGAAAVTLLYMQTEAAIGC